MDLEYLIGEMTGSANVHMSEIPETIAVALAKVNRLASTSNPSVEFRARHAAKTMRASLQSLRDMLQDLKRTQKRPSEVQQ